MNEVLEQGEQLGVDKPERRIDSGIASLALIARHHGVATEIDQIRHAAGVTARALNVEELQLAARRLGLKAGATKVQSSRVASTPFPALAIGARGDDFIVIGADSTRALILEPLSGAAPRHCSHEELIELCGGQLILFASRASAIADIARFDFTWFIPAIVKYRTILAEVVVVSFFLQLLGLVSPLVFQVVMDKAMPNRAFDTLTVACAALSVTALFEVVLTGLRNYVLSHTTNRIDVELGSRLYRHLMALPLKYFATKRVGDTVARMREVETIRGFLTSQAVTGVIDIFFSIVFFVVMASYSGQLTAVVAGSLVFYAAISLVITPLLRRLLVERFAKGADNQSFLVETVSAAETVKAMAVEPQFIARWDKQLAAYVSASFDAYNAGNLGQQLIQLVGKAVNVFILFYGTMLVIRGSLTMGQFVAFNMMAQRVAAPILRLSQVWQDFQQVGISMQRLGDILNSVPEQQTSGQALPTFKGHILFEDVSFRYRQEGKLVLDGVGLEIIPGQTIGVVGRSGSGKSTLTKLVQRLHVPVSGRLLIDGIDASLANPAWIRRNVGVVLQENILFNRSIRENIALGDPGTALSAVMAAAKLAGAHDFITELPEGYETQLSEHGGNLSGGQRQRIAIARALVTNPKVLIFDEATSALDFETESVIRANMAEMSKGRTVIIIAHRLSAVRHADVIYVMEKGRIAEKGTHAQLTSFNGLYARLASFQNV